MQSQHSGEHMHGNAGMASQPTRSESKNVGIDQDANPNLRVSSMIGSNAE